MILMFKDSNLHFLVNKYSSETEIGKAINILLKGDECLLKRYDNVIGDDSMPNMEVLQQHKLDYEKLYRKGIEALQQCQVKHPRNPDILALIGYGYNLVKEHMKAIEYYNKALEIKPEEIRFIIALVETWAELVYELKKNNLPESLKQRKEWTKAFKKSVSCDVKKHLDTSANIKYYLENRALHDGKKVTDDKERVLMKIFDNEWVLVIDKEADRSFVKKVAQHVIKRINTIYQEKAPMRWGACTYIFVIAAMSFAEELVQARLDLKRLENMLKSKSVTGGK